VSIVRSGEVRINLMADRIKPLYSFNSCGQQGKEAHGKMIGPSRRLPK
jgi:hypothetical protein